MYRPSCKGLKWKFVSWHSPVLLTLSDPPEGLMTLTDPRKYYSGSFSLGLICGDVSIYCYQDDYSGVGRCVIVGCDVAQRWQILRGVSVEQFCRVPASSQRSVALSAAAVLGLRADLNPQQFLDLRTARNRKLADRDWLQDYRWRSWVFITGGQDIRTSSSKVQGHRYGSGAKPPETNLNF